MRKIPVVILFMIQVTTKAQVYHTVSNRLKTSGKFCKAFTNTFNAAYNPALIPFTGKWQTGLFCEKKYLLPEMNLLISSASFFKNNNGIALLFQHFGSNEFYERIIGIGYGKCLGRVNAGVMMQYINVKVSGYRGSGMFQAGVSSVINISEFISAGITILNPPLLRTSKQENSRCATVFSFGAGFQPASVMYTGVELRKEEGLPLNIIFTLQHHFDKKFSAGLNWSALENQPFVCTGWETSRFKFEAGCGYHMNLGPSPSISVIINKINN